MTPMDDLGAYLSFAHRLADLSGEAILPWFRQQNDMVNKDETGAFDPVTAGDRAGEKVMREAISETFPDHGIVGEEFGIHTGASDLRWILDPVDGTRGFVTGLPVWGTLIALADPEQVRVGLMNQPFTGDRFWADGETAYCRTRKGDQPISTRACLSVDQAILTASDPDMFADGFEKERFQALEKQVRMRRFGTDCYAYCMLAAGNIDLVVEADMKIYDIAALVPIIEKAGGRVTTWDGGDPLTGSRIVAAGDPALHEAALTVLNG